MAFKVGDIVRGRNGIYRLIQKQSDSNWHGDNLFYYGIRRSGWLIPVDCMRSITPFERLLYEV